MKGRDLRGKALEKEFFEILMGDERPVVNLTRTKIIKIFARTKKGPPKFNADDIITLSPDLYPDVREGMTTIGIFIMNKVMIERLKHMGYINKPFNGSLIKKIEKGIAYLLLEKMINPEDVFDYIDHMEFLLGGPLSHIINPAMDVSTMSLPASTRKLREQLFKENEAAIQKGDPVLMAKIEKQLVDHALMEMRKIDSPALAFFDSGCGIDPYNIYKTIFISKGPVLDNNDPTGTKFNIITSNYDEGIKPEDMAANNDSFVTGAYHKGKSTGISGYYTKKYNSMYLEISLDKPGSDCKTKKTVEVLITPENVESIGKYHYIMVDDKPILLTPKTVKEYLGKTVNLRSPAMCEHPAPGYCSVCYGDMAYRINRTNVGTTFASIPNARMNADLKKFHDTTIRLRSIGLSELGTFLTK